VILIRQNLICQCGGIYLLNTESKQLFAIIALVFQALYSLMYSWSSGYALLFPGGMTIDASIALRLGFILLYALIGIIAFRLAYQSYSGNEHRILLRYWAFACLCYALIFSLLMLSSISTAQSLMIPLQHIIVSLVPAIIILNYTGLSERKSNSSDPN